MILQAAGAVEGTGDTETILYPGRCSVLILPYIMLITLSTGARFEV